MKKRTALKRERVNRTLESMFDYLLTVIEAPIGYGKTTAVREFLSNRGGMILWLTFLSSVDTASFFWNALSAEIGRLDAEAGSRLKNLGFPADAPQMVNVMSILNGLDFGENTVLVIDDFHLAKNPQIVAFLALMIKEPPENLHIAIITRDTSALDISELTAKGLCNILPQQTFCFTEAETRDYCTLMGYKPNDLELKKINEYTGGWISMIYLTLLGIKQGIPMGKSDLIDELVEKALFNAYDEDIRRFLLQLSVMDAFTAEQALFVTEEPRAEEFLKKLRRENAFISYDQAKGVYKIHNVLLDFLRVKQKDRTEQQSLYCRLGEWYLTRKAYTPAKSYFFRAGEIGRILELLDNEDTITYGAAYFEGFFEMFTVLPRETLFQYPLAYIQYLMKLMVNRDQNAARDGLARLNELQSVYEKGEKFRTGRENRVLGEISLVRLFSVFNDIHKMRNCLREAARLLEGAPSSLIKRKAEFTFAAPHQVYVYYREQGKLRETMEFMEKEFNIYPEITDGCGMGCDYLALAEYALETGDWQAAELNAFKTIYKAKTKEQTGIVICANFTLIRLYIYQGKISDALEFLKQLRADVAIENNPFYNTTLDLIDGYVYACLGRYDSIPAWLQTGDMSPAQFMFQGVAFNYIVYGKAVLLSKKVIQLEILTGEFRHYFSIFHNQLGFLHNQILEAAAKYRLYGMEAGRTVLEEAVEMARADHIILPFAEYAPAIIDMVQSLHHSDSRDLYTRAILEACEQYMVSLKHTPQSSVSLSDREIEILTLTAEGLKRDDIAVRLHLAPGTVKNHLENIYRKLEVGGRTAAIKKARELKLL